MDFNEYIGSWMVRERHAELMAAARRQALISEARRSRRSLRAMLGTALIRAGAWLLRDHYTVREAAG